MLRKSTSIVDWLTFALGAGLVLAAATGSGAHAQTLSVVHSFTGGSDGGQPFSGFLMNSRGTLYGTASTGGSAQSYGVVYKIMSGNVVDVLHTFTGQPDGATPMGGVVPGPDYALYGTTMAGGTANEGTVFRQKGLRETVLYSFAGGTDGANPIAGLAVDAAGNLYGTTSAGGATGNGTVFELVAPTTRNGKWKETVLYSFAGGTADGATPVAGVYVDAHGNLFGTTSAGGGTGCANNAGCGTIFELSQGSWHETYLYSFQDGNDGAVPYAGLVADASGNLYGAATEGGVNEGGTVFELTPSNGSWNFSPIASVPGWGISGTERNLVLDSSGNIYATTHCDGNNNAGTIYELSPSNGGWTYNLLYTFTGGSDGLYSISNLVLKNGKLFGTTQLGGASGAGVIYALKP